MVETDAEILWRAKDTFAGRVPNVRRETSSLVAITAPTTDPTQVIFTFTPVVYRASKTAFSLIVRWSRTIFCIETRLGQIVGAPSKKKLTILYLININNIG